MCHAKKYRHVAHWQQAKSNVTQNASIIAACRVNSLGKEGISSTRIQVAFHYQ